MIQFAVYDQDTKEFGRGGHGAYGFFESNINGAFLYGSKGPATTFINQYRIEHKRAAERSKTNTWCRPTQERPNLTVVEVEVGLQIIKIYPVKK